jgi:ankyrin repeat protein
MPVRRRRKDLESQLCYAIEDGDLEEVKQHLAAGANPSKFDSDGETAMHTCGRYGNAEMAKVLLDAGAKVDACGTSYVATPLCLAAIKNDIELVKAFLDAGADININCANVTPLSCATRSGNVEMMRFLLEHGANVTDDKGKSMLQYITEYTKNREDVEQLLREHGAE